MTTISDFMLNKLYTLSEYVSRVRRTESLTGLITGKGRYIGKATEDDDLYEEEYPYNLYEHSYAVQIEIAILTKGLSSKGRRKILPLSVYSGCDSLY